MPPTDLAVEDEEGSTEQVGMPKQLRWGPVEPTEAAGLLESSSAVSTHKARSCIAGNNQSSERHVKQKLFD
jgi:hypothetical protein